MAWTRHQWREGEGLTHLKHLNLQVLTVNSSTTTTPRKRGSCWIMDMAVHSSRKKLSFTIDSILSGGGPERGERTDISSTTVPHLSEANKRDVGPGGAPAVNHADSLQPTCICCLCCCQCGEMLHKDCVPATCETQTFFLSKNKPAYDYLAYVASPYKSSLYGKKHS